MKFLKKLIVKRDELTPLASELNLLNIDLGDMEGSIQLLKAEADAEHKIMLDFHSQADEIWNSIKPMFEERDFLQAEGDRLHSSLSRRKKKCR